MTEAPGVLNLRDWIDENANLLRPPVANTMMSLGTDLFVQVVGGPNQRTDYHVDPYDEWFYQVRGTITVGLIVDGRPKDTRLGPGDTLMLPAGVPHSPQRPEPDSVGIVIERVRPPGTTESFQWYCRECTGLLFEVEVDVNDVTTDLPAAFERFHRDPLARTCSTCGAVHDEQ